MDADPEIPLTDLERRLAGLAPATDGLNADALLFAAGRAAAGGGPGRWAWPALAAGFAGLAVAAVWWGGCERAGRVALAEQLAHAAPPAVPPAPVPYEPSPLEPAPTSYLSALRALARDDPWEPVLSPSKGPRVPAPPPLTPRRLPADDIP